ncbi:hypothetical protein JXJ21_10795 [candidate division KSB1 bacterium]|nr:hypothetical protein [candidate division KSB1 bacterium]
MCQARVLENVPLEAMQVPTEDFQLPRDMSNPDRLVTILLLFRQAASRFT